MASGTSSLLRQSPYERINQTTAANEPNLLASTSDDHLAKSLWRLSDRLRYMRRREDTLMAMQEAVELYRQLAADCPKAYNPDLATCLNNLSVYLSDLGLCSRTITIREVAEIFRRFTEDHSPTFNPNLAPPLPNLFFSDMGSLEDALRAIQEAVEIRRRLAADHLIQI